MSGCLCDVKADGVEGGALDVPQRERERQTGTLNLFILYCVALFSYPFGGKRVGEERKW